MKNKLNDKTKLFSQYFGQLICVNKYLEFNNCMEVFSGTLNPNEIFKYYLKLKSLNSISDEDALMCIGDETFKLYQNDENNGCFGMSPSGIFLDDISFYINEATSCDYLRSKGYALPYMGLSVDDQIKFGWIKLF